MKTSKLKFVIAFALLVVVAVVSSNVKALTMPNSQLRLSVLLSSRITIEDGDDPSEVVTPSAIVKVFNAGQGLGPVNPAQFYTLSNTGRLAKAYTTTAGATVNQSEEYTAAGAVSTNVGLALAAENYVRQYNDSELADQESMEYATKSKSLGVQAYIWSLGGANYYDQLDGTGKAEYDRIATLVEKANQAPSYAGQQKIELEWNEETGRYEKTITDTNDLAAAGGFIQLILNSANPSLQYAPNGNSITFYSYEQVGSVDNPVQVTIDKHINGGWYTAGSVTTKDNGTSLVYLTDSYVGPTTYTMSFYTNALKVQVTKTLKPSDDNPNTGDAKVEGAHYGVYSDSACTNLVEEIVTNAEGVAETRPLEVKDYYVKELTQSEGCLINDEVMEAKANSAVTGANGQKVAQVSQQEQVIYGGFDIVCSNSHDLSGSTTKWPSAGSELELTLDSDPSQKYNVTVDKEGHGVFDEIPYGHYTLRETKKVQENLDYMDPLEIYIHNTDSRQYRKLENTDVTEKYVTIENRDAETGKLITGDTSKYRVTDDRENVIEQTLVYPEAVTLDEYETGEGSGFVRLQYKLPYGTYRVYQTKAPYGYYNASRAEGTTASTFPVQSLNDKDNDTIVVTKVNNIPQKGIFTYVVKGNVLTSTNSTSAEGIENVNRPGYSTQPIPGVEFELTANEAVVTKDGTVRMRKGETKTYTTDATGTISDKLYIGEYSIKITSVPEGYILDDTAKDFSVEYQGELVKTFNLPTENITLERQKYTPQLTKTFSGLNFYKEDEVGQAISIDNLAYKDVKIGIYAAEDIKNVLGTTVIRKDTLVDVVTLDAEGNGLFRSDYPMGKFYAKELATNENYELDSSEYPFEAKPTDNKTQTFKCDMVEIVNHALKVTKVKLTKIETVDMSGYGPFRDFDVTPKSVISKIAGVINDTLVGPSAETSDEMVDVTTLAGAKMRLMYFKGLDDNNEPILGKVLELVDGEYVEVVRTTDENGEINIEGLPYGTYAFVELEAPRYYDVNDKPTGFVLSPDRKEAEVAFMDDRSIVDVDIDVYDEFDIIPEHAKVQLIDPETGVVAYETEVNEEGVASFVGIRAGRYIRKIVDLEEYYVVPKEKEEYLEKTDDSQHKLDNMDDVTVKYVRGNILIVKTDDETGEPVPGCKFVIKDEDGEIVPVVNENGEEVEIISGEDGTFLITELLYGKYTVEEVEAAENYEKSDLVVDVDIVENNKTYTVEFTNVNTGDIAVALYAVIALVSVAVIAKTVKKLKRD